jgi:transcriptional regulator with XRE-family HTH domain
MGDTFDDLFSSAEKDPSYWMQVALLEFLQSLAAMRASRGKLSKKELAALVGVSPATLSRWLNGNENLTVKTMCRLAVALGAAVHIHVADQNDRGRWRPEVGMADIERPQKTKTRPLPVLNSAHRSSSGNDLASISAATSSAPFSSSSTGDLPPVANLFEYRARGGSTVTRSVPEEQSIDAVFQEARNG